MPVCDPQARERFLRQVPVSSWTATPHTWHKPPPSHSSAVAANAPAASHQPHVQPTRRASMQDLGTLHQRWAARRQSTFCRQSAVVRDPIGETEEQPESPEPVSPSADRTPSPVKRHADGDCHDDDRRSQRQHPPPHRRRKTLASLLTSTTTSSSTTPSSERHHSGGRAGDHQDEIHEDETASRFPNPEAGTRSDGVVDQVPASARRHRRYSMFSGASSTAKTTAAASEQAPQDRRHQRNKSEVERLSCDASQVSSSETYKDSRWSKRADDVPPLRTRMSRRFSTIFDRVVAGDLFGSGSSASRTRRQSTLTGSGHRVATEPLEVVVEGRVDNCSARDPSVTTSDFIGSVAVMTPTNSTATPDVIDGGLSAEPTFDSSSATETVEQQGSKMTSKTDSISLRMWRKDRPPSLAR
jgi:hypothetical protein